MESAAFDYDLPQAAIAQHPAEPRDQSRLLVAGPPVRHLITRDLPSLVGPGDVLVVNNTKVLPARLALEKPTGGAVEVLALEPWPGQEGCWEAMVKPSRRVANGTILRDHGGRDVVEVREATGQGTRIIAPVASGSTKTAERIEDVMERVGAVPLPPYITAKLANADRYQTVFADHATSVAAPTAGLHFTNEVLKRCQTAGADVLSVELAVGVGTFRPLEADNLEDHDMHSERYVVRPEVWEQCLTAKRVVAVGTTVVRTLESVARTGAMSGRTDLFLTPGDPFHAVDALLTNFHMPKSTLLVLLESFMGPRWRDLYALALDDGYRFLSFGDAMFVERHGMPERQGKAVI